MFLGGFAMRGFAYHHAATPRVHIAMWIAHTTMNAIPSIMKNPIHNYESKVDFLNEQAAGANLLQPCFRGLVARYQPRTGRMPGQPARSYQNFSPSERRSSRRFRQRSDH